MDKLAQLEALARKATPGPYYAASDDALDTIDHKLSGLACVDTGRQGDWSIARIIEWPQARYIAALDPATILALIACVRAADAMRANYETRFHYDAARAQLEQSP